MAKRLKLSEAFRAQICGARSYLVCATSDFTFSKCFTRVVRCHFVVIFVTKRLNLTVNLNGNRNRLRRLALTMRFHLGSGELKKVPPPTVSPLRRRNSSGLLLGRPTTQPDYKGISWRTRKWIIHSPYGGQYRRDIGGFYSRQYRRDIGGVLRIRSRKVP
jgi:hypothetical protein